MVNEVFWYWLAYLYVTFIMLTGANRVGNGLILDSNAAALGNRVLAKE